MLYEGNFFKHNMVIVLYPKGQNKITGLYHCNSSYRAQEKWGRKVGSGVGKYGWLTMCE